MISVNGIGRSATIVMAYLMQSKKIKADEARKIVLEKRPCVTNRGYMYMLYAFQQELQEKGILPK